VKKLILFYNYCVYRLKAVTEHGVHSPFVFDLVTNVIYNRADYYCYKGIEALREQLPNTKEISNAAKYDHLIFRLANYFQPSQTFELGTSTGITAIYMASASSKTTITTVAENSKIAEVAKANFKKLNLKNIEPLIENFDVAVSEILTKNGVLDFIHFSGDLSELATLNYFNKILSQTDNNSMLVFDSIYRSSQMKNVWTEIKNNNQVSVTIDLFNLGIVFFRKEQVKQHFIIKF
jgi:predicted O-methyltransferase YrrM